MDPNSGKLYPTVDDALAAGVEHPVEVRGRDEDVRRVADAVAAARDDGSHECPKTGCDARVNRNLLACRPHWALVSKPTQVEVYAAYRTRRKDLMRHVRAVQAAVAEMNR